VFSDAWFDATRYTDVECVGAAGDDVDVIPAFRACGERSFVLAAFQMTVVTIERKTTAGPSTRA